MTASMSAGRRHRLETSPRPGLPRLAFRGVAARPRAAKIVVYAKGCVSLFSSRRRWPLAALLADGGPLGGPLALDPRRALLPGALARAARRGPRTRRSSATFEGPLGAELRRRDPQRSGRPGLGPLQRPVLRAPGRPAARRGRARAGGGRARDARPLGRRATWPRCSRSSGCCCCASGCPIAAAVDARHGLPAGARGPFELSAHRQLGARARDRGPRVGHPRAAARTALADPLDALDLRPLADARQHLDPDRRGGMANPHVEVESSLVSCSARRLAAALPVALLFSMPMRELLAMMLNDFQPAADPSWGFVGGALSGRVRGPRSRPTAASSATGPGTRPPTSSAASPCCSCSAAARARAPRSRFLKAGAVAGALSVLVIPIFSAFRLELVCVPMAAFGLGLAAERLAARAAALSPGCRMPAPLPGRSRT